MVAYIRCGWDGTPETEDAIKNETKATIRCIPLIVILWPDLYLFW